MRYEPQSDTFEGFLNGLNDAAAHMKMSDGLSPPGLSAQIVGLPRSGTTVLLQLLAASGAVGYPSNVMAFFHRAPWVGAMLHTRLAASGPTLSMESLAGRTREPLDPHEFGYFWRRISGHSANSLVADLEPTPPEQAQVELDAVAAVFGAPVVYKNFLALAHASNMRAHLERQRFISVVRSAEDVAGSLLALRKQIGAGPEHPVGVQATQVNDRQAATESIETTVARQVVDLEGRQRACEFDKHQDALTLSYTDLVGDPRGVVGSVLEFLGVEAPDLTALPRTLPPGRGLESLPEAQRRQLRAELEVASTELKGPR